MELAACHARSETLMIDHDKLDRNETPTTDQLSVVYHLVKHGLNLFVDLGVFGPNAMCIVRWVRLTASRLNNEGERVKIEINGPVSFGMW